MPRISRIRFWDSELPFLVTWCRAYWVKNVMHFKSRTQAFFWCSWKSQGWAMKYKFIHNKQTKNNHFTMHILSAIWFDLSEWRVSLLHVTWKVTQNTGPSFSHVRGSGHETNLHTGSEQRKHIRGSKARLRTAHSWYTVCLPRQQCTQVWQCL